MTERKHTQGTVWAVSGGRTSAEEIEPRYKKKEKKEQEATPYDGRKPAERALCRLGAWSLPGSEIMARTERGTQELGRPASLPGNGEGRHNKTKADRRRRGSQMAP